MSPRRGTLSYIVCRLFVISRARGKRETLYSLKGVFKYLCSHIGSRRSFYVIHGAFSSDGGFEAAAKRNGKGKAEVKLAWGNKRTLSLSYASELCLRRRSFFICLQTFFNDSPRYWWWWLKPHSISAPREKKTVFLILSGRNWLRFTANQTSGETLA